MIGRSDVMELAAVLASVYASLETALICPIGPKAWARTRVDALFVIGPE